MIKAEIVADSIGHAGDRITSYILSYPRIIHSELMTHRVFSRNAASSRAIPAKKLIKQVKENPFVPIAFQRDHKGMQGTEYLQDEELILAQDLWRKSALAAANASEELNKNGVTKQLSNRMLEPYQWYQSLVTATEYDNFFKLRKHEAAEIHIQALANAMWDSREASKPKKLEPGEWHIPFGDKMEGVEIENKIKIATARAARISYMTFGDNPEINFSKDIKLHDELKEMGHMSPFEHCARTMTFHEYDNMYGIISPYRMGQWVQLRGWCRNMKGFIPYREIIENEWSTFKANFK